MNPDEARQHRAANRDPNPAQQALRAGAGALQHLMNVARRVLLRVVLRVLVSVRRELCGQSPVPVAQGATII